MLFPKRFRSRESSGPNDRCVSRKELAAYSFGGIGVKIVSAVVALLELSSAKLLAGSALGIRNGDLATLNILATVIGIALGFLRGMLMDNTRSKKGKLRPYLLLAGIPSALLMTGFIFLPFETMSYSGRLWSLFATNILLQLCFPLYDQAYTLLAQVMSPSAEERAGIISVSAFIYSLGPSAMGLIAPVIAGYAGGLEHIAAYRILIPGFSVLGVLLGLFSYFGTRERIVVSKSYTPGVPFRSGIAQSVKNRFLWAHSLQSWCLLLQLGINSVTVWYFYYGVKDVFSLTTEQQGVWNGVLTSVLGAAAVPAILLSPVLIRRLGKRRLVIAYTLGGALSLTGMLLTVRSFWAFFAFSFLRTTFSTFPLIADPAINADILDYQQYRTGSRLEGLMGQLSLQTEAAVKIGVTFLIQTVVLQNHFGLTDNYDDLYSPLFREPMARAMILFALVGYLLSLIPFTLLYTLSEEKLRSYITVLKLRAALEDYADGVLSPGQLAEAARLYREAKTREEELLAEAAAFSGRKRKKKNASIEAQRIVLRERELFLLPETVKKVESAEKLVRGSADAVRREKRLREDAFAAADALPEGTRREAAARSKALREAKKRLNRFYREAYPVLEAEKLLRRKKLYDDWDAVFGAAESHPVCAPAPGKGGQVL